MRRTMTPIAIKLSIPVVVMTNLNIEEEEVKELGACKLIVKSDVDCADICEVLHRQLSPVKERFAKANKLH
jgi:hypothetical protein